MTDAERRDICERARAGDIDALLIRTANHERERCACDFCSLWRDVAVKVAAL